MLLKKIISGGQTGADQAALRAARELGLLTGGWMPRGWRTEDGPRPDLGTEFGLVETHTTSYSSRAQSNVLYADATLIFGNPHSPGCTQTLFYATRLNKHHYTFTWQHGKNLDTPDDALLWWLDTNNIVILNVAGNRESKNPGIHDATKRYLLTTLGKGLTPC